MSEYTYWALTSLLGAQNYPWRIDDITQEWELFSPQLVCTHDPAFVALYDDPRWALPQTLPDGRYVVAGGGGDDDGGGDDGGGDDGGGGGGGDEPPAGCRQAACAADDDTLCLNDGRFAVETTWTTSDGTSGEGHGVQLTGDTGYFWFFGSENVEVVTKVLRACVPSLGNSYWVFAGGLTDVQVEIRVCDTEKGILKTYLNPNVAFRTINDTAAFPDSCP